MMETGEMLMNYLVFSCYYLLILTKFFKVLLRLTWLTVDPLEYWVKADPAEQVDLRNIRS